MKIDTLDIARRIVSRLRQSISLGYAAGPFHDGENGAMASFTAYDGRLYRAYVTCVDESQTRPAGFDHIMGERPKIDQLRIAEIVSKSLSAMARISTADTDVDELEPWHKAGVAGFFARSTAGDRFLIQIREISFEEQIDEARKAIGQES